MQFALKGIKARCGQAFPDVLALSVKDCNFYIRMIGGIYISPKTTRTSSDHVEQICIVSK